ncbi:hypothetical protein [Solibacillus sp. FSL H8-0538]|uniref:hypothetical protein n=1 Tax=Solibacillus sp. FSL H8-0538 TaxID=2921400 RepID=UPI0030F715A2
MQVSLMTSLVSAVFFAITLKLLHLFHLIKWKPVGYAKKWEMEGVGTFGKWLLLIVALFVVAMLFYVVMQFVTRVPAIFTSFVIGLALAIVAEWVIFDYPAELTSFKKLSIPFIVMVIITLRFIFETASFGRRGSLFRQSK